jgi:metal-responsive CopG/Arc/MetJ family transcriptional regulator
MPTLTLKVPRELAAKLNAVAARKRVPKSQYVRDVLSAALNKEKQKPSLHELMKGAIGCFDGPSDLSTNPKYLKGYGKWRA